MKQNAEEPDYRSMNEVQLKYELIQLEKKILDITGDPLDYQHYRRFLDWSRNEMKVNEIEELMSDRCLILNLLFGCHCTPAEVERLEKVNDLLLEMTNRTYHRTADLVRALLVMKKDDMDDDYMIESRLVPIFDIPYSVDYITLNVPSGAFSNVPLRIWSLSVRQSYYFFLILPSH